MTEPPEHDPHADSPQPAHHSADDAGDAAEPAVPNPAVEFFQLLHGRTPKVYIGKLLVAINIGVFLLMLAMGVHFMRPTVASLIAWGADYGPKTTSGQWWRLLTAAFIHIGILHLLMNMWALWNLSQLLERLVGHVGLLVAFLAAAVAGNVASVAWHPYVVGAGASGGVFGLAGCLLGFMLRARGVVPMVVFRSVRNNMLAFIALNIFFGFKIEGIDNAAHLGGLAMGFVAGLLLGSPLTAEADRTRPWRNGMVAAATVGLVVIAATVLPQAFDLNAAIERFGSAETEALAAYNQAVEKAQKGELDDPGFAKVVRERVLPVWQGGMAQLVTPRALPDRQQKLLEQLQNYGRLREQAWTMFAEGIEQTDQEKITRSQQRMAEAESALKALIAPK